MRILMVKKSCLGLFMQQIVREAASDSLCSKYSAGIDVSEYCR